MGVATGTAVQSCAIDIPSDLDAGEWDLVVVANGIASEPVSVNLLRACEKEYGGPRSDHD